MAGAQAVADESTIKQKPTTTEARLAAMASTKVLVWYPATARLDLDFSALCALVEGWLEH